MSFMKAQDYSVQQLEVGYESGADRLVMWLPVVVRHVITPESPLASWLQPGGTLADADSCILVVVRAQGTAQKDPGFGGALGGRFDLTWCGWKEGPRP